MLGEAPECWDPPSARSGHGVLGASQRMERLWSARSPQYPEIPECRTGSEVPGSLNARGATGCVESPSARTEPGMYGATPGCRDPLSPDGVWGAETPWCTESAEARTGPGLLERHRVQGRALGCWDSECTKWP